MRQIAGELDVSVATIHEDVSAELLALRDRTRAQTEDFRDLELLRMCRPGSADDGRSPGASGTAAC